MKIENAPQDVTVHGDFATSDFAVGDLAFIVDMFADKVYSHKERAVIRELACNAHDSHVMAGTTDIGICKVIAVRQKGGSLGAMADVA